MFLEKVQGIKAEDSSQTSLLPGSGNFANRQQARIEAGLDDLEINTLEKFKPNTLANNDAALRVACLLDWGLFRKRFSLATRPRLQAFLNQAHDYAIFADTAPQA